MSDLATALPCRRPELVARPFGESGSYLVRDRHQGESFQLGPQEYCNKTNAEAALGA
jgi:hypothetical protein